MTKIESYTKPQTPFYLLQKDEGAKKTDFINIPFLKNDDKKEVSLNAQTIVPQKSQETSIYNTNSPKIENINKNYMIIPLGKKTIEKPLFPGAPDFFKPVDPLEALVKNTYEISKKTGLSQNYIERLTKAEGIRLEEYKDEAGIKTIGIGHNINADPHYTYGKTITKEIALTLFTKDLKNAQNGLKDMLQGQKLKQGQEESLIDLIFNMGAEKFGNTKLLQLIKEKRFAEATKEFDVIKAGKKVSVGLCLRRIENINRFCGESPSDEAIKTMKKIKDIGAAACDRKIRKSRGLINKNRNKINKAYFVKEAKSYIENITTIYKKNAVPIKKHK